MTNPEAPVPFHDFKIAVTKRLGLNPDEATMLAWGDDGHVDVRFFLPVDEIWAILNGEEEESPSEDGAEGKRESVSELLDAMLKGGETEWHIDEHGALRPGPRLAEWEREFLASQEMTEELRKTREELETLNVHLNRTESRRMRQRPFKVWKDGQPVWEGSITEPREHMFATYADGTLAYCSCGKTEDLKQHAREVLP